MLKHKKVVNFINSYMYIDFTILSIVVTYAARIHRDDFDVVQEPTYVIDRTIFHQCRSINYFVFSNKLHSNWFFDNISEEDCKISVKSLSMRQ